MGEEKQNSWNPFALPQPFVNLKEICLGELETIRGAEILGGKNIKKQRQSKSSIQPVLNGLNHFLRKGDFQTHQL